MDAPQIILNPVHIFDHVGEDTRGKFIGTPIAKAGEADQDPRAIICLPYQGSTTVTLHREERQEKWRYK